MLFFFYLLCYALIPELLPIMLFKMCLLFLNYAAINHNYIYIIQISGSCIQRELYCSIMEASTWSSKVFC